MNNQYPWKPEEDALLGTDTDRAIADRLGRTREAVKARRFALKIRPRKAQPVEPTPFSTREQLTRKVGQNIAAARIAAGLTQKQASSLAGIATRLWQKYEAGLAEPGICRCLELANALGTDITQITKDCKT